MAILASSWQSPDGRIGHLLVNIAETRQPLKVSLDTRNAPVADSYDAQIYRSTQGEAFRPLWRSQRVPKELAAELEPLEVVFVELSGSGKAEENER